MEQEDPVFVDSPSILLQVDRLIEFFPNASMTVNERVNAIARLTLYSSILWSMYHGNGHSFRTGLILIALLGIMWKNQTVFVPSPTKVKLEKMVAMGPNGVYDDGPMSTLGAPPSSQVTIQNAPCQLPTLENPFMNTNAMDDGEKLPACRGPGVQQMAENLLNSQLYADPADLFGQKQMQRTFYTLPSTTIPEDREKFGKWLFKDSMGCKTNSDACAPLDDLRREKAFPVDYMDQQQSLY
jgi:hypothetical protein